MGSCARSPIAAAVGWIDSAARVMEEPSLPGDHWAGGRSAPLRRLARAPALVDAIATASHHGPWQQLKVGLP